jgi:hypothetical protein
VAQKRKNPSCLDGFFRGFTGVLRKLLHGQNKRFGISNTAARNNSIDSTLTPAMDRRLPNYIKPYLPISCCES